MKTFREFLTELNENFDSENVVSKGIFTKEGKKIQGSRSGYLVLMEKDSNNFLKELTWKQFKASSATFDSSAAVQDKFVTALLKTITQFNKQVDYNSWSKRAGLKASFEEKVDMLLSLGAKSISKNGLKY